MPLFRLVHKLRNVILAYGIFTSVIIFTWLNTIKHDLYKFNDQNIITDREVFEPLLVDAYHAPVKMNDSMGDTGPINIPMKSSDKSISPIIHLVATWPNGSAPSLTENWLQTWRVHNPSWQILVWSKEASRRLISKANPELLGLYDSYPNDLFRSDVVRYVILYHYGGVYADIDMECLKPFDDLLESHTCLVAQEPELHRVFLHKSDNPYLTNAFMACRRNHPFFKQVIDNLHYHNDISRTLPFPENSFQATGPKMLQKEFWRYESLNETQDYSVDNEANIDVPPAEYFLPRTDGDYSWRCSDDRDDLDIMTSDEIAACELLKRRNFENRPTDVSYTDHHWLHTYNKEFEELKPQFRRVTDMLSTAEDAMYYV